MPIAFCPVGGHHWVVWLFIPSFWVCLHMDKIFLNLLFSMLDITSFVSPFVPDASSPSSSLWPLAGLTLVCLCLSWWGCVYLGKKTFFWGDLQDYALLETWVSSVPLRDVMNERCGALLRLYSGWAIIVSCFQVTRQQSPAFWGLKIKGSQLWEYLSLPLVCSRNWTAQMCLQVACLLFLCIPPLFPPCSVFWPESCSSLG